MQRPRRLPKKRRKMRLLTEDDIAEVEALAQAYYDAVDAETVQDGNATNEQVQNPLYEEEDQ